jgi:hypothetical protein
MYYADDDEFVGLRSRGTKRDGPPPMWGETG